MKLKLNEPDLEDFVAFQHILNWFYGNVISQLTRKYFFLFKIIERHQPCGGNFLTFVA